MAEHSPLFEESERRRAPAQANERGERGEERERVGEDGGEEEEVED